ncbi:unnamed protein product [Macrosiphum euphorbiae]|uniref:Secreted protein n=1 Tax=Macrosiphum euphorbiae TaxID=13131 RepID=A0AAV0WY73_9HEMI|nr:unnamed protein product [Macrosiphum euphorbiae]
MCRKLAAVKLSSSLAASFIMHYTIPYCTCYVELNLRALASSSSSRDRQIRRKERCRGISSLSRLFEDSFTPPRGLFVVTAAYTENPTRPNAIQSDSRPTPRQLICLDIY